MPQTYQLRGLIDFSLIYDNILEVTCSLPLKVSIWGRKGSETAKNHDFFILSPQIVIFGLSELRGEKLVTLRGTCPYTS